MKGVLSLSMCGKSNNIDIIAAQKVERQKVSCNKANMYS